MPHIEIHQDRKKRFDLFIALFSLLTMFSAMSAHGQNYLVNKKFISTQNVGAAQTSVLGPNQTSFLEFNIFNSATGTLSADLTDTQLPMRGCARRGSTACATLDARVATRRDSTGRPR